jgi:hypothetical protein
MRVVLFILLLVGVPFQAALSAGVRTAEHSCCGGGGGQSSCCPPAPAPCCPDEQSCDCGCVLMVSHPLKIEDQAATRGDLHAGKCRTPGAVLSAVTRRDRPPSPPPRGWTSVEPS